MYPSFKFCCYVLIFLLFQCKHLSLYVMLLSILAYVVCTFGFISKKSFPNPMWWNFYTMFSSKCFIVLGLMFRTLIHFELIFVYGVRQGSNFIPLHVNIQFSQHQLLKRLSFLNTWYSCWKWFVDHFVKHWHLKNVKFSNP